MDKAAYKVAIEAEKWMMEAERLKAQLLFRDTTMLPEKDAEIESLRSELQKQKDEFNDMRNNFHQINKQLMDDLVKQKELNAELVKASAELKKHTTNIENQNELWIEAIKDFNKKEHTQDGRNLLMEKYLII